MLNYSFQQKFYDFLSASGPFDRAAVITFQALIILAVLRGYGFLFSRAFIRSPKRPFGSGALVIFGVYVSGTGCLLLNFIRPITASVSAIYIITGLVLNSLELWGQRKTFKEINLRSIGVWALCLGLLYGIAAKGLTQGVHPDTGIYHLPAISWVHYAAVPLGSSNLLGGLAWTTFWTSVISLFWHPWLLFGSMFCVNIAIASLCVSSLVGVVFWKRTEFLSLFAPTLAIVLLIFYGTVLRLEFLVSQLSSVSNDLPAASFAIMACFTSLRILSTETRESQTSQMWLLLTAITICSLIKLTYLPLFILVPATVLTLSIRDGWRSVWFTYGPLICRMFALAVLPVCAWLTKSFMTSGCMIFPISATCFFDKAWAGPEWWVRSTLVAQKLTYRITTWSNAHNITNEDLLDSPIWIVGKIREYFLADRGMQPLVYSLVVGLFLILLTRFFRSLRPRISSEAQLQFALLFGTSGIDAVFWFLNSPGLRYATGTVPIFCLAPVAFLLCPLIELVLANRITLVMLTASLVCLAVDVFQWTDEQKAHFMNRANMYWPTLPTYAVMGPDPYKTESGETFFVGRPAGQCFASEPPCGQWTLRNAKISTENNRYAIYPLTEERSSKD